MFSEVSSAKLLSASDSQSLRDDMVLSARIVAPRISESALACAGCLRELIIRICPLEVDFFARCLDVSEQNL